MTPPPRRQYIEKLRRNLVEIANLGKLQLQRWMNLFLGSSSPGATSKDISNSIVFFHIKKATRDRNPNLLLLTFTAAVVLTFFVCWAPFHAQRLLYLYGQKWEHYKTFNEWLFVSGGYLYYISW